jgi:beta-galactosidase
VRANGQQTDRYLTPFGIRTIEYTKERGFLLNGKPHRFHGVCNHHDLGALGAAINRRALERQIEIMKAIGVNAIRTSHNPPAPELLDLCDRMGVLVMDEAFDMWARPKVPNGLSKFWAEWHEKVRQDHQRASRLDHSRQRNRIGRQLARRLPPAD